MTFDLEACRFQCVARDAIHFRSGLAGNVLRGALGKALREIASKEDYERIFEPAATGNGPSGFVNRPRPFVIRRASLDARLVQPGEQFCFDLHVFDPSATDLLIRAFGSWAEIAQIDREAISIDLAPTRDPIHRIRVEFQTPTDLKAKGSHPKDAFPVLLARARDRVSTLRGLYGSGPLAIDFRALAGCASHVETVRSDLQQIKMERRSGRTGQRHDIGGLVGFAEYQGDLGEFLPYLRAAAWTGVGRHCTWGNGQIDVAILNS